MKINPLKTLLFSYLLFLPQMLLGLAYVCDNISDVVHILDTDTNTFIGSISVGSGPSYVAITPDGSKAYVANIGSNDVSVIDTVTSTVIATVPVGLGPIFVAITPNGEKAYVANTSANTISVINVATDTVIGSPIATGSAPFGLSVSTDGNYLFVNNSGSTLGTVIDTTNDTIINTVPTGILNFGSAVSPNGNYLYTVNFSNDTVLRIFIPTLTADGSPIPVGSYPEMITVTANGLYAYVANTNSNDITVIDLNTITPITTIPLGVFPLGIASTPNSEKVFVGTTAGIYVIDVATNTVSAGPLTAGSNSLQFLAVFPDQSPVAQFTTTVNTLLRTVDFDGSSSFTPDGTIISYAWDFGDGTTFTSSSPTTSHTYLTDGVYTVTLSVTNSNNTSTSIVFTGQTVSNNGSALAEQIQTISIINPTPPSPPPPPPPPPPPVDTIFPPQNLQGFQGRNRFASQYEYFNQVRFTPPNLGNRPILYKVYRNSMTHLIKEILASNSLEFIDNNRRRGETTTYYITSVDSNGNESLPSSITIR
ncbi:MAG: hypothetical protein BGO10_01025 [Chlamydia sp. 32-24]|mgnify:FL=1|nr:MAG: hypothetical protein BGO10_01025 [Chlamydia sp. 32-24]